MVMGGTAAATLQGYALASNSVIARVPLAPWRTCSQNVRRPTPKVDTTPIPVIAIRSLTANRWSQ
jgi:hypothetical protein